MNISIEAICEAGVFKPLSPLPDLKEHERVRLTLEPVSRIAAVPEPAANRFAGR